jgi:phage-related minor tail protein
MAEFSLGLAELGTELSLEGLEKGLEAAKGEAEKGGNDAAASLSGALKLGMASAGLAVAGAFVGIGVAAFGVASDVQTASNDMQASLGLTKDEADDLGNVALEVWGQNWGDSIGDVSDSLITIKQQMKGISDEALPDVAANALAVRDTFGVDIAESTNAANTLMQNFGLTSDQAFDFITKGFQSGLDSSGDFLDTVGEYSTQFKNGGADAGQFFSLLQSGIQGGVLGTDKAADAFKEFGLRIADGSDSSAQALKGLGINSKRLWSDMASGKVTTADAFQTVIGKLNAIKDPVERNRIGVALLGTQYEDLGASGALALDLTGTKLEDLAGSTDSLNAKYNNWPSLWEGIKRTALVALKPLGDKLLEVANSIMPLVQQALGWLQNNLPGIIDIAVRAFQTAWTTLQPVFQFIGGAISSVVTFVGDLVSAFQDAGAGSAEVGGVLSSVFGPVLGGAISTFVDWLSVRIPQAIQTVSAFVTGTLLPILSQVWSFIQTNVLPILADVAAWLLTNIPIAIDAAVAFFNNPLLPTLATVWSFIQTNILPILASIASWLLTNIPIAIQTASDFWNNTLLPALNTAWSFIQTNILPILAQVVTWLQTNIPIAVQAAADFWNNVLKPALDTIWGFIQNNVIPIFNTLVTVYIAAMKVELQVLANFWNNILKPALNAVWEFISNNVIPIFKTLVETNIAALKIAVQALADLWNNTLKPALNTVWSFLDQNVIPVLKTLADTAITGVKSSIQGWVDIWNNSLKPALQSLHDFIENTVGPALSRFKTNIIDPVVTAFNNIKSAVQGVMDKVAEFLRQIANAVIPDWLRGHSPPPMADWFNQIGEGAAALNMELRAMPLTMPGPVTGGSLLPIGAAPTEVRIVLDGRGADLLRQLIRVEIADSNDRTGRIVDGRLRNR